MRHGLLGMARSNNGDDTTSDKQSYATTVLLEEVATLRKRVKELEDNDTSTGSSTDSNNTPPEASNQDDLVASLRRDLSKSQNEKATMELQFMNQLSALATDHNDAIDELRTKMAKSEGELALLKDSQPKTKDEATLMMEKLKASHEAQMKQLQDDLEAADKELGVHRNDADEFHRKFKELEMEKKALLKEIMDVRSEAENGSIIIGSLRKEMDLMEKNYTDKITKLELQSNENGLKQNRQITTLNNSVVKLENAKSMLLDEITDLRMQLDRDDVIKTNLLRKIEDFNKQQSDTGSVLATASVEKRAKGAESKVVELEKANEKIQAELREMTKSYKTDVSRLEEAASSAENLKIELQRKENNLADVHERCKHLENELKIISTELAREKDAKSEARAELKALQCQRVSSSDALQQHLTEIDAAKMENLALKSSVEKLKNDLDCEKAVAETLKAEIIALKSTGSVVATRKVSTKANFQSMAPAPLSPTPSYKQQGRSLTLSVANSSPLSGRNFQVPARAVSPSMQGNSVKSLAAAFEPSPPGTPRAVFAGFRQAQSKQEPCAPQDAERGLDRQKVEELRLQIEMGERKIIELEGMKQKAHEQKRAEIEELQYQLGQEVEKNAAMEEKLKSQSMVIGELRAEVATLTATRTAIQSLSRKEFEEQSKKDREEILRLRMEMDGLRDELQSEMKEVETLKSEIRSMTLDRINQEENAMGSYDNKIEANQRSFDVEVNALQMQLTKEQMRNARLESDYQIQIKELEDTIEELNFECDKELDAKQAELDMMKHKLAESLDAVAKLESERDQLCISMNTQSNARKTQFDELQSELLQKTAENAQLARDIEKLQMHVKLDEDLSDELEHLREKVKEFEAKQRPSNSGTMKHMESMQVNSLRAENNKLRDTVRQVAMEKQALQTKLNTLIEDKSESKSLQILRERNDSLKLEVDRLTKKLQRRRNEQRFEL